MATAKATATRQAVRIYSRYVVRREHTTGVSWTCLAATQDMSCGQIHRTRRSAERSRACAGPGGAVMDTPRQITDEQVLAMASDFAAVVDTWAAKLGHDGYGPAPETILQALERGFHIAVDMALLPDEEAK